MEESVDTHSAVHIYAKDLDQDAESRSNPTGTVDSSNE